MPRSIKILPFITGFILCSVMFSNHCLASFFGETLQNQDVCESAGMKGSVYSKGHGLINITHVPRFPQPNQKVTIRVEIGNSSINVKRVVLLYRERLNYNWYGIHQYWGIYEWSWPPLTWNVYTDWINVTMTKVGDNVYETVIPELPYYTIVWYQVHIFYDSNKIAKSDIQKYYVVRGTEYIIYSQASNIINRILYVAVALALIYGLRRRRSSQKNGGGVRNA